ncbi:MAG: hypothetical protein LH647_00560 [Leptolyngbyaceae cyanobacterium CAN_BIN12]|nr:hypothetical protein [Leptolyngbyaceae cyanobacterium CAN_BIN12]
MKHAGQDALDGLEGLLMDLRQHLSLKEKKRGIFYWKSNAFLHFHEDHDQLFVDLRVGSDWERFPVDTQAEREMLLAQVAIAVGS